MDLSDDSSTIIHSFAETLKTLTDTMKEIQSEIRELKYEVEELRDEVFMKEAPATSNFTTHHKSHHTERIKSLLQVKFENMLRRLTPRQRATMRQQLRYYTAGIQRVPISREEAYEIILAKAGEDSKGIARDDRSELSTISTASAASTNDASRTLHNPRLASLSLVNYRHLKLLNGHIQPTLTFSDFMRDIRLEIHHADMMLENTYADGMAKVIYDVIKLQMVAHESAYSPWIAMRNEAGKGFHHMYCFTSSTEGWNVLSAKNIEECFNIFTRNMMFLSNEWRRRQTSENSSPEAVESAIAAMAHMNHIGKGNHSSLESERKKILGALGNLLELEL